MSGLRGRFGSLFGRGRGEPVLEPPAPAPGVAPGKPTSATPRSTAAVTCYRVTTHSGATLSVSAASDGAEAQLVASASLDAAHAAIAIVPDALPNACLLAAPDVRAFGVAGDGLRSVGISARLLPTTTRGIVRLRYPLGSRGYLDAGDELRFDGAGTTMQAAFLLHALSVADVPASALSLAREFGAAAAEGLGAAELLARLRTGALRPELAEPLIRLMGYDELDWLGHHLMGEAGALALLQRAMPGDVWVRTALPALVAWLGEGRPPVPGHVLTSMAQDEEALLAVAERRVVPAGLALQALARRHVLPRRTACVLATARNEGPYLLDWIAYHQSIGFEHLFLYTNDNQDGSDPLLAALAAGGAVTLVHNENGQVLSPQEKAYAHALTVLPQILDYRWTAVLDLDEYLAFDAEMFDGIGDFLGFHETQPVDAVALCWVLHAGLPGETWSEASPMVRFPRRMSTVDQHVKSLFRTRQFWYSQPHFPSATLDAPFHYRTQDGGVHHHPGVPGRIAALAEAPAANQAWINHYILRTGDEALWKWSRGRGDWPLRDVDAKRAGFLEFIARTFLDLARPEHLVDDRRILSCARNQPAALEKLLAMPGVAHADAQVKAGFAEQLARNTADFLADPMAQDAPETIQHFRELLRVTHS